MRAAMIVLVSACATSPTVSVDPSPGGSSSFATDPRFKWVDAFAGGAAQEVVGSVGLGFGSTTAIVAPAAVDLASAGALVYSVTPYGDPALPQSQFDDVANKPGAFATAGAGRIVTGLAFAPAGIAMTSTPALPTTVPSGDDVAEIDLPAYAAAAGSAGVVISALAIDTDGDIHALGYADSDTDDAFDEIEVTAAAADVPAAAQALGAGGYVVTACGWVSATEIGLVGTRAAGATAPFTVQVVPDAGAGGETPGTLVSQSYAIVGGYFADRATPMFILER